ncbi:uncharacterized protein METZ01_LOCUS390960, partial [marine metagenome]
PRQHGARGVRTQGAGPVQQGQPLPSSPHNPRL